RGGRLSAAAAALGTVLGVRPLLAVREGRIEVVQKVRTRTAAVERLTTVAVDSAGRRTRPALAAHHVGGDDGADRPAAAAPAPALGTVLGVRPRLAVREGRSEVVQKVRTRTAAVERLTTVAVDSAGRRTRPALAVHHVGDDDGAHRLAAELTDRTGLDAV